MVGLAIVSSTLSARDCFHLNHMRQAIIARSISAGQAQRPDFAPKILCPLANYSARRIAGSPTPAPPIARSSSSGKRSKTARRRDSLASETVRRPRQIGVRDRSTPRQLDTEAARHRDSAASETARHRDSSTPRQIGVRGSSASEAARHRDSAASETVRRPRQLGTETVRRPRHIGADSAFVGLPDRSGSTQLLGSALACVPLLFPIGTRGVSNWS